MYILTNNRQMPGETNQRNDTVVETTVTIPLGAHPKNILRDTVYQLDELDGQMLCNHGYAVKLTENLFAHESRKHGRYLVRQADGTDKVVRVARYISPEQRAMVLDALDDPEIRAAIVELVAGGIPIAKPVLPSKKS